MLSHTQVPLRSGTIHLVDTGGAYDTAVLFLHGWPQDWSAWEKVLHLAGPPVRALAVDLPGIGESTMPDAPSSKRAIANCIHELVATMGLVHLTLVGQDVGGQVVFAYLTQYPAELEGAVIMNVVVPGVRPWEDVIRNPYIWHFAFHSIPQLPEMLVMGKQRAYFDYFYDLLSANPAQITQKARDQYTQAYQSPTALKTGFEWYRAFTEDAKENSAAEHQASIETPLLYLRGEREGGDLDQYLAGFRETGIHNVQGARIPGAGHFAADEQPESVWQQILAFVNHNNPLVGDR